MPPVDRRKSQALGALAQGKGASRKNLYSTGDAAPSLTLAQMAGTLEEQLQLTGTVAEVVRAACYELGVSAEGKALIEQARECYAVLDLGGVSPWHWPTATVPAAPAPPPPPPRPPPPPPASRRARPSKAAIAACLQKVGAREADVLAARKLDWSGKGLDPMDGEVVAYFVAASTKLESIRRRARARACPARRKCVSSR